MRTTKPDKICLKCRQRKDKSNFAQRLSPYGNGKRSDVCSDCRVKYHNVHKCCRCDQMMPADQFPRYVGGRRSERCLQCAAAPARGFRTCSRCKKRKETINFRQTNAGFSFYCLACHDELAGPQRLRQLDRNCVQCNAPIMVRRTGASNGRGRKYCSYACSNAAQRFIDARCVACKRTLPRDAFPTRLRHNRRMLCCIECRTAIQSGRMSTREGMQAFFNAEQAIRRACKRHGCEVPISRRKIQEMVDGCCALCGFEVHTITLADDRRPPSAETIVPCCMPCKRIQGRRTLDEIRGWVTQVAMHTKCVPASAPSAPPSAKMSKYSRQLARSFDGKTIEGKPAKRQQFLPPHVQQNAVLGETFEQKVARYARAQAELADAGRRARPESDENAV